MDVPDLSLALIASHLTRRRRERYPGRLQTV